MSRMITGDVWEVTSPEGISETVKDLHAYCEQNKLSYGLVWGNKAGWRSSRLSIDAMAPKIEGYVHITDAQTNEVILSEHNAIHYENMSHAIALTLAHRGYGHFNKMVFGNGASTVAGTGTITYFPANIEGIDAAIYNQTYEKIIDDNNLLNDDDTRNFMEIVHSAGTTYTDIVIHCYLDYNEPSDQEAFDDTTNMESFYVFDELGIVSYPQNGNGTGRLLTHCIFNPIQKSLNRAFEIEYTIRIYLSQ